jgi:isocitrate/isopropylmalate dehydrogenase
MQVHTFFDRIFRESAREFVDKTDAERVKFRSLFESTAGAYVVLKPETFEVVAVSDSYLRAISKTREELMGRCLFEVFPEIVGENPTTTIANMRLSIERVMKQRSADALPCSVIRSRVPKPRAAAKRNASGVPSTLRSLARMARSPSSFIVPRM